VALCVTVLSRNTTAAAASAAAAAAATIQIALNKWKFIYNESRPHNLFFIY
jgi:hypothetical protein